MPGIDSYTKLLILAEGEDESTTFSDSSGNSHTVTGVGTAQVDTSRQILGQNSILFSGAGHYITVTASADFWFGSDDFTIDFWVYPTVATRSALFAFASDQYLGIDFHQKGTRNVNMWAASASSWDILQADNVAVNDGIGRSSITLDSWSHIAYVRHDDVWMLFVNGMLDEVNYRTGTLRDSTSINFLVGRWGTGTLHFTGNIGIFRISKGIARWVTDFDVPTQVYTSVPEYTQYVLNKRDRFRTAGISLGY